MAASLTLLYRGFLDTCNYGCSYCPFPKNAPTSKEQSLDRESLCRFVRCISDNRRLCVAVFFTPRGEALIYECYRDAIVQLSHMKNVSRVVAQTNLSMNLGWLNEVNSKYVGLWCTYHPAHERASTFLDKCNYLTSLGITHSVGMVGVKDHLPEIEMMRSELNNDTYLWVNAFKRQAGYYSSQDMERICAVDPLFELNCKVYKSRGKRCRCGESLLAVDGKGDVRRCHFTDEILGNIYQGDIEQMVVSDPRCPNETCHCHIGYVHMFDLKLYDVFGDGVLERIPKPSKKKVS